MIERYGYARYMKDMGGENVGSDKCGTLWRLRPSRKKDGNKDAMALVEVHNGSLDPDGTRKTYFISVPPECETAIEAVAWTYGLTPEQYGALQVRT